MRNYKIPESVLVVIYVANPQRILMLKRKDDPTFWQSVTGSVEKGEYPKDAAIREVMEETGIDILQRHLTLVDSQHTVIYDIHSQFLHRYAPGVTKNKEHWFYLPLPDRCPIILTEHDDYHWLPYEEAAALTKSWNNAAAILQLTP